MSDVTNLLTLSSLNDNITLVKLEADESVDRLLAGRDGAGDKLALGAVELTVIQKSAEGDGGELVAESTDVAIQGETLQIDVGDPEDGGTGGLVTASRLDTDESVLDDVNTANTVLATESVEGVEDVNCVSVFLCVRRDHKADRETAFEFNRNALGIRGCVFGCSRQLPHVSWRGYVGIFENSSLVRDMEKILISRPWLGGSLDDWDPFLFCILQERLTSGETVVEG